MEVASGLNSAMQIPGDSVLDSGFDADNANGAYPNLPGLSILTCGLLHLKLDAAL